MSRIVITSHGTLGDNLPLLALAEELQERGHSIVMVLSPPMHAYALRSGLTVLDNGRNPLGPQEAQGQAGAWNHWQQHPSSSLLPASLLAGVRAEILSGFQHLMDACMGADLLLSTPLQQCMAAMVHERTGLPWTLVSVTPSLHGDRSTTMDPRSAANGDSDMARPLRHLHVEIRKFLKLPALSGDALERSLEPSYCILGSSSHFSEPPAGAVPILQTGFWFYADPLHRNWQPDPALRAFFDQDPAPLILSFSSLPLEDAASVLNSHVQAAAALGYPILIQKGWAGFRESQISGDCNYANIMVRDYLPQDWLFAHASALIHHGGIGTTARSLRNGCPMLIEPYGNDQFFNARQVLLHGVGAAMHPGQLSVDGVARILEEKVLSPAYRSRACDMGARIAAEQGLAVAATAVEDRLQG